MQQWSDVFRRFCCGDVPGHHVQPAETQHNFHVYFCRFPPLERSEVKQEKLWQRPALLRESMNSSTWTRPSAWSVHRAGRLRPAGGTLPRRPHRQSSGLRCRSSAGTGAAGGPFWTWSPETWSCRCCLNAPGGRLVKSPSLKGKEVQTGSSCKNKYGMFWFSQSLDPVVGSPLCPGQGKWCKLSSSWCPCGHAAMERPLTKPRGRLRNVGRSRSGLQTDVWMCGRLILHHCEHCCRGLDNPLDPL